MIRRPAGRRLGAFLAVGLASVTLTATAALAAIPRASFTDVESQLICVTCHEPLALAQSPQSVAEKALVKTYIAEGMTKPQILREMVAQYGVAVLGKPPATGFNLTVYILPPAVLVLGIGFLIYTLPKWRERSRKAAVTPLEGAPDLDPDDKQRLDEDLASFI
jgi:cytochrome c-type biogenesis protein CcmH